jgi:hypothetical protein
MVCALALESTVMNLHMCCAQRATSTRNSYTVYYKIAVRVRRCENVSSRIENEARVTDDVDTNAELEDATYNRT